VTGQQLIDAAELSTVGHAYIRCREAIWANSNAYIRLSVVVHDGKRLLGPWAHLYDRKTQEAIGEPTPQSLLTVLPPFDRNAFLHGDHEPWTGPLDAAETERERTT